MKVVIKFINSSKSFELNTPKDCKTAMDIALQCDKVLNCISRVNPVLLLGTPTGYLVLSKEAIEKAIIEIVE